MITKASCVWAVLQSYHGGSIRDIPVSDKSCRFLYMHSRQSKIRHTNCRSTGCLYEGRNLGIKCWGIAVQITFSFTSEISWKLNYALNSPFHLISEDVVKTYLSSSRAAWWCECSVSNTVNNSKSSWKCPGQGDTETPLNWSKVQSLRHASFCRVDCMILSIY